VETQLLVQLLSTSGGQVANAYSDSLGQVEFRSVSPGTYRVRVTGSDIEEAVSDAFNISPHEAQHIEIARVVLAIDPANPEALLVLASAQLAAGKREEALANARRVHALPHERYTSCHLLAARILELGGRGLEAAREYELFLQESPQSPHADQARKALVALRAKAESN